MKLEDVKIGRRVAYVPGHAEGNVLYPDVEHGTVSSKNDKYVFVKFDKQLDKFGWEGTTSQSCDPADLVDMEPQTFLKTVLMQKAALKSSTPNHPLIVRGVEDGPGKVGSISLRGNPAQTGAPSPSPKVVTPDTSNAPRPASANTAPAPKPADSAAPADSRPPAPCSKPGPGSYGPGYPSAD